MTTAEVCRRHGLSPETFYKLKAKYGGMEVSDAHRLKSLEDENAKRKRLVSYLGGRAGCGLSQSHP
jgi:putative transposase